MVLVELVLASVYLKEGLLRLNSPLMSGSGGGPLFERKHFLLFLSQGSIPTCLPIRLLPDVVVHETHVLLELSELVLLVLALRLLVHWFVEEDYVFHLLLIHLLIRFPHYTHTH